jgi:hypothetical protein
LTSGWELVQEVPRIVGVGTSRSVSQSPTTGAKFGWFNSCLMSESRVPTPAADSALADERPIAGHDIVVEVVVGGQKRHLAAV